MASTSAPTSPQALDSTTFRAPPLDGSLSMPQIYDLHAEQSKDHPFFVYEDSSENKRHVTYGDFKKATHRAARILQLYAKECMKESPVFAVLAAAGEPAFSSKNIGWHPQTHAL